MPLSSLYRYDEREVGRSTHFFKNISRGDAENAEGFLRALRVKMLLSVMQSTVLNRTAPGSYRFSLYSVLVSCSFPEESDFVSFVVVFVSFGSPHMSFLVFVSVSVMRFSSAIG
jgi:hypothetical protein